MLDAAYRLLAKVVVNPDLTLESPDGGRIRVTRSPEGALRINCDRSRTVWEVFDMAQSLGLVGMDYRSLRKLRNPFLQALEIEVDDRDLIYWPPGKLPRVLSMRGVFSLLKRRRNSDR